MKLTLARWQVTQADFELARLWASRALTASGVAFTGNIETIVDDDGEHIVHGALGEMLWQRYVCPDAIKLTGSHIGSDFEIAGIRIDVKTKRRNVDLQPDYVFQIPVQQRDHETDWYAFISFNMKSWMMEYVGCISKKHFWNASWLCQRGERHGTWTCSKDCHVIELPTIIQLNQNLPHYFKINQTMAQENKPQSFIMFPNDYAKTDKHPQWKGKIVLADGTEQQIVAWEKKTVKGVTFLSGKFEPFRNQDNAETGSTPY